jgi:hypothetical protein
VIKKIIFWENFVPEDAPQPKESKSAFKRSFALCAVGSAGPYVSGRTPSAVLPFCQQALEYCREHCMKER